MLFKLIHQWFIRRREYKYYLDVGVDRKHVKAAVEYAKAVEKVNVLWPGMFDETAHSAKDYACYMLGHFVLNVAAAISFQTFYSLTDTQTPKIRADTEASLKNFGHKAWELSDNILWTNLPSDVLGEIYGLVNVPCRNININTPATLDLIGNDAHQLSSLMFILNHFTLDLKVHIDEVTKNTPHEDRRYIEDRLKCLYKIASDYKLNDMANNIQKLHRRSEMYQIRNKL